MIVLVINYVKLYKRVQYNVSSITVSIIYLLKIWTKKSALTITDRSTIVHEEQ